MNTQPNNQPNDYEWVILEAMGHRTLAGRYFFENGLHRIDIPDVSPEATPGAFIRTERYGGGSIYCITSVDEATARTVAKRNAIPEAIPWDVRGELKKLTAPGEQLALVARDTGPDDYDDDLKQSDDEDYGYEDYGADFDDD
jgi:hypothetical protein